MQNIKISEYNKKAIDGFINKLKNSIDNQTTLDNKRDYMSMLFKRTDKDYDKITLDEILQILANIRPTSAEVMKPAIRMFYTIQCKRPEIAENIPSNTKVLSRQTKGSESKLTKDEIDKIIEAPKSLRDKAIVETFIVSGIRNTEERNLRISDVNITDTITTWIKIKRTKTNTTNTEQNIPIVTIEGNPCARFPKYLREWYKINEHLPPEAYLFYPRNNHQKQLSKSALKLIIDNAMKEAKITRIKITPHIFRHTGASYEGIRLSENMLSQKYGWKDSSQMLERYCHHDAIQLEQELKRLGGYTTDQQTNGRKCPRCGEINNVNEENCKKCNLIINPDKLNEIYKNNLTISQEIAKNKEEFYYKKRKLEETINNLMDKRLDEISDIIIDSIHTKFIEQGIITKEEAEKRKQHINKLIQNTYDKNIKHLKSK
jgi:integrase